MPLSFKLSKSILSTISPPIPTAYKWIPKLKLTRTASLDILDMSQGVPGTVPHPLLQQSLRETSQRADAWGYCPAEGEWQLREALALGMRDTYGHGAKTVDISPNDIAITSGCNLAFVATIMAIADAGDEVILPVPWYFNHQMTLTLLGITPIPLITSPESSFLPSAALASSLITSKTRAIALVTPNNPTGAVYPPSLIAQFAKLASEKGIALILDETYRDFIVGDADVIERPHGLFDSDSESEDKLLTTISNKKLPWHSTLISLYSFSKSYRIPGHRLGAITASPELLREICKVLDTLQICAPRVPQLALAKVFEEEHDVLGSAQTEVQSDGVVHARLQLSTPPLTTPGTPRENASESELGMGAIPITISSVKPVSSVDTNSKKSVLSALKFDILSTALAIHARQRLFKDTLEKEAPRWKVVSQGAYYAFVQHPFPDHGSEEICRKLVEEVGVRVLPGSFFFDKEVAVTSDLPSMRELDRYIRFSVANVSDEKVVQVCRRLGEAERMFREEFGWLVEGEV
ncbi:pyridoxal phosphate-dependent transferase [Lentinula detonsa]|uniref:Pyridoxal phosphate-dependent transferase n=1 Tax=Lentinula detonsa TaxID=2804962 RepID=A0AA38UYE9_9AGAR|nr:pyridoxal phosphate-dependent transferase [Lentinula detonsa]